MKIDKKKLLNLMALTTEELKKTLKCSTPLPYQYLTVLTDVITDNISDWIIWEDE